MNTIKNLQIKFAEITANNIIKKIDGKYVFTGLENLKSLWNLAGIEYYGMKVGYSTGAKAKTESFETRATFRGNYSRIDTYSENVDLGWVEGSGLVKKISDTEFSEFKSYYRSWSLFGERSESSSYDKIYEGYTLDSIFKISSGESYFDSYHPVIKITGVVTPEEEVLRLLGQILIEKQKLVPISEKKMLLVMAPELTDQLIRDISEKFGGEFSYQFEGFYWMKKGGYTHTIQISTAKVFTYHDGREEFDDTKNHFCWFYYSQKKNLKDRISTTGWDGFYPGSNMEFIDFVETEFVLHYQPILGIHKDSTYRDTHAKWCHEYEVMCINTDGSILKTKEVNTSMYTPYFIGRFFAVRTRFNTLEAYFERGVVLEGLNEELEILYQAFANEDCYNPKYSLEKFKEYAQEVQPSIVGYEILLPTFE